MTPRDSDEMKHFRWIENDSGFPEGPHYVVLFFHGDGENVLGHEEVSLIFQTIDTLRSMDEYDDICKDSDYQDANGETTCEITGVPRFWNSSTASFEANAQTDDETIATLSQRQFADGTPVAHQNIYGRPKYENEDEDTLESVMSYSVAILTPRTDAADEWGLAAVDVLLNLDDQWAADPGISFRVETETYLSFGEELNRGLTKGPFPSGLVLSFFFTLSGVLNTHMIHTLLSQTSRSYLLSS